MKRFLSLLLACCLSLCMVPALAEDAPDVLTIGVPHMTNVLDWDTNYMTLLIEENCNVDLQFVELPYESAEIYQKLSMWVSGGTELPDILVGNWMNDLSPISSYGADGVYMALNDYFADESKTVNMRANIPAETFEYMLKAVTSPDGNIYGIPAYAPEIGNEYCYRAWINKTWLDALGLEMPSTTEEFYNVLKAFKEQDPNGNGKADEIPMIGATNGWNLDPVPFLMNAFIYADKTNDYLYIEDGQIKPAYTQAAWLEGLKYINRLVTENLVSPLSFTQDQTSLKTILENEEIQIVGSLPAGSVSVYQLSSQRKHDLDVLPPLTGPEGACYATYNRVKPYIMYVITTDCDNPDAAFRVADYMFDADMAMIMRFGKEGENWSRDVEGLKGTYEDSLGVPCGWKTISDIWGIPQNNNWVGINPTYRDMMSPMSITGSAEPDDPFSPIAMTAKAVPYYLDKHPEETITVISYTPEEQEEISVLAADLRTFVLESTTRFVVGQMSFDQWDTYLQQLEQMGLSRYLEIQQTAYDRTMGK